MWRTPRGIQIHTRQFLPKGGEKPKVLMISFHGIGAHCNRQHVDKKGAAYNDLRMGRESVKRGWGYFTMDAQGHGFSEGLPFYIPSHQSCVEDACAYVQEVRRRFPNTPWFVAGESWGGNIALMVGLALQEGPEADREGYQGNLLVAPAIIGDLPPCPVVFTLRYLLAPCCPTWTPFFMPQPVSAERIWRDDEIRAAATGPEELGNKGNPFRLGTAVSLLWAIETMQRRCSDITFPFAIAHGSEDAAVPLEGSQLAIQDSKTEQKDKELRVFEGAYHDLLGDPDTGKVVDFLFGWAEGRLKMASGPVTSQPGKGEAEGKSGQDEIGGAPSGPDREPLSV